MFFIECLPQKLEILKFTAHNGPFRSWHLTIFLRQSLMGCAWQEGWFGFSPFSCSPFVCWILTLEDLWGSSFICTYAPVCLQKIFINLSSSHMFLHSIHAATLHPCSQRYHVSTYSEYFRVTLWQINIHRPWTIANLQWNLISQLLSVRVLC